MNSARGLALTAALCWICATPPAIAFEPPATSIDAMEFCCAPNLGVWQGEGWLTLPDGGRVDVRAEFRVYRVFLGTSVMFDMTYLPKSGGAPIRKVALMTFERDYLLPETGFHLRYLMGGPPGGAKEVRPGYWGMTEWNEVSPNEALVRYVSQTAETHWSLAGFCCSASDTDQMAVYVLLRRVDGEP